MRSFRYWFLSCCVIFGSVILLGCGASDSTEATPLGRAVYVDTRTRETFVCPVAEVLPAVNPSTKRRTLMPGLYCTTCRRWYPVPPADQINRAPGAALCPETGNALTTDGPWPEAPINSVETEDGS